MADIQTATPLPPDALLADLRALIDTARQRVAGAANAALTLLYWRVGQRISTEVLRGKRAGYGEEILPTLSAKLVREYGASFGLRSLRRMVQFAEAFPDEAIVSTLSTQLTWSHFIEILPLRHMQVLQQRLHRAVQLARERAAQSALPAPQGGEV